MHEFNFTYAELEKSVIATHKAGGFSVDTWNKIVDLRAKVAPIAIRLNENWKLVPDTDASVEAFIASPDFQSAVELALQIVNVAGANEFQIKFDSLKR